MSRNRPTPVHFGFDLEYGPGPIFPYTSQRCSRMIVTHVAANGFIYGYPQTGRDKFQELNSALEHLKLANVEWRDSIMGGHYGARSPEYRNVYRCEVTCSQAFSLASSTKLSVRLLGKV